MTHQEISRLVEQLELINLVRALERTGNDAELLREVAGDFLDTYSEVFDAVVRAIEDRNGAALQRSAHSLKGAVRNFGAEKAQTAAYRLEAMGRLWEFEGSEAAVACLRRALEDLRPEMELLASR
jgi:HPt (histidine-containing phosphotransfer) domain-containing protein